MDMLTLSHVAKHFGEKQVLNDVCLHVPEHTVFGFVGQNGAGKTTSMKLILGLLACDSGEIEVNGMPVRYGNTATNRFIGYLPDVPEFYSFMTSREYLRFCGEITGMPTKEIKNRSQELLELVGLAEEKRRIKGFSRGMKQRLGIAQALLNRPKLLICDEPTSVSETTLFWWRQKNRQQCCSLPISSLTWSASVMSLHFYMTERLLFREPWKKYGRYGKLQEQNWRWKIGKGLKNFEGHFRF